MNYFIIKDGINESIDLFHFLLDLPVLSSLLELLDKEWEYCQGNILNIFNVFYILSIFS